MKHRRCPALRDREPDPQPANAEAVAKEVFSKRGSTPANHQPTYVSIFDDFNRFAFYSYALTYSAMTYIIFIRHQTL